MRLSRVVTPCYPHHVTQCGNRRRPLFFDNGDYPLNSSDINSIVTGINKFKS